MDEKKPPRATSGSLRARRGARQRRKKRVRQNDKSQCKSETTASCESASSSCSEKSPLEEESTQFQSTSCNKPTETTSPVESITPTTATLGEPEGEYPTCPESINNNNDGEGDEEDSLCSNQSVRRLQGELSQVTPSGRPADQNPTNAVRVLFREQESRARDLTHSASYPNIVSANRRLIERQIEAIQMADSRRWNFDFRNCTPLAQTGHRYFHTGCLARGSLRGCRPLNVNNSQTDASTNRFIDEQESWQERNQRLQTHPKNRRQGDESG